MRIDSINTLPPAYSDSIKGRNIPKDGDSRIKFPEDPVALSTKKTGSSKKIDNLDKPLYNRQGKYESDGQMVAQCGGGGPGEP